MMKIELRPHQVQAIEQLDAIIYQHQVVSQMMSLLRPREVVVMRLRHGFDGGEHTWKEIGSELRVSGTRAYQIYERGRRRLYCNSLERAGIETEDIFK